MNRFLIVLFITLIFSLPVRSEIFTVGFDGEFPSLELPLFIASLNGEDDEIRIQTGLHFTDDLFEIYADENTLEISGGWNDSFTSRVSDPSGTEITGLASTRVISLDIRAGSVWIHNLTLEGGRSEGGSGADLIVSGNARLELSDCLVENNLVITEDNGQGAGVRLAISDSAEVEITRCEFIGNVVSGPNASGGGLQINAMSGRFNGSDLYFFLNRAQGEGAINGGAISIHLGIADPIVDLKRLEIIGSSIFDGNSAQGSGLFASSMGGQQQFSIEGAEFIRNNRFNGPPASQIEVQASSGNHLLRSIVVVDGNSADGFVLEATGDAQILASNLTASANLGVGIRHESNSSAVQSIENSIAWNNQGGDLVASNVGTGALQLTQNSTSDPGVINAEINDYRLLANSSAIDNCMLDTIAGLGTFDANGGARLVNGQVDCGAYEWSGDEEDVLFKDAFESS